MITRGQTKFDLGSEGTIRDHLAVKVCLDIDRLKEKENCMSEKERVCHKL